MEMKETINQFDVETNQNEARNWNFHGSALATKCEFKCRGYFWIILILFCLKIFLIESDKLGFSLYKYVSSI